MGSPYRDVNILPREKRIPYIVRLWYRFVGKLVYGGPRNCAHCKFWTPSKSVSYYMGEYSGKGDCKLLFGKTNTQPKDTCDRFNPCKKYMHREKTSCV